MNESRARWFNATRFSSNSDAWVNASVEKQKAKVFASGGTNIDCEHYASAFAHFLYSAFDLLKDGISQRLQVDGSTIWVSLWYEGKWVFQGSKRTFDLKSDCVHRVAKSGTSDRNTVLSSNSIGAKRKNTSLLAGVYLDRCFLPFSNWCLIEKWVIFSLVCERWKFSKLSNHA